MTASTDQASEPGCPGDNTITLLVSGQLDAEHATAIERHVAGCPECRAVVDVLLRAAQPAEDSAAKHLWSRVGDVLAPHAVVGRYRIERLLGSGGMGVVYAAHDPELDRTVAIKLLYPSVGRDADRATALLREAQALARLAHPNVVGVHDVGRTGNDVWVAMEYVAGTTLAAWIARQSRSLVAILDVFVGAGQGLAAAHEKAIVHRDFKPANVLLSEAGVARVADFGLASWNACPPESAAPAAIVGTPRYMSPEQIEGLEVGPATDQFAFCASLYQAVTGISPFAGTDLTEVLANIRAARFQAMAVPARMPRWLELVLMRGLSPAPADRYATMNHVLAAIARGRKRRARRIRIAGTALAIGAIGAAGLAVGVGAHDGDPCRHAGDDVALDWTDARRAAIAGAFSLASGDELAHRVTAAIDHRAEQWRVARVDACHANRVRGEQSDRLFDLRVACLDRRLGELDSLARALSDRISPKVAGRALDAIDALPPIEACADARALLDTRPGPDDPRLRANVEALYRRITAASTDVKLGRMSEAIAASHALHDEVEATGDPSLRSEQRALETFVDPTSDPVRTEARIREQIELAAEAHDDVRIANGYAMLIQQIADHAGHAKEAEPLIAVADAAATRSGDPEMKIRVLHTTAIVHEILAHYDEARRRETAALQLARETYPDKPILVSRELDELCAIDATTGAWTSALDECIEARRIVVAERGVTNREVLHLDNNLAVIYAGMERVDDAIATYRRVADGAHRMHFAADETVAWLNLADIARHLRRWTEAIDDCERARAVGASSGNEHDLGSIDAQEGIALIATDKLEQAQPMLARALANLEKALGADHPELALALRGLAEVARRQHRPKDALALIERAARLTSQQPADQRIDVVIEQVKEVDLAGDHVRARALARDARATLHGDPQLADEWLADLDGWQAAHGR